MLAHLTNLLTILWMALAINGMIFTYLVAKRTSIAYHNLEAGGDSGGALIVSKSVQHVSIAMVAVQLIFLGIGAFALVSEVLPAVRGHGFVISIGLVLASAILSYTATKTWLEHRNLLAYITRHSNEVKTATELARLTATTHQESMDELHSIHADVTAIREENHANEKLAETSRVSSDSAHARLSSIRDTGEDTNRVAHQVKMVVVGSDAVPKEPEQSTEEGDKP